MNRKLLAIMERSGGCSVYMIEVQRILEFFLLITTEQRILYSLLPIIKNNVYTFYNHIENNTDLNPEMPATMIYSDSFATYQVSDFNNLGYILHKVNHTIGVGRRQYHTN